MAVSLYSTGDQDGGTSLSVTLDAVTNGILIVYTHNNSGSDNATATFDGNAMTKFAYKLSPTNSAQHCTGFYYLTSSTQTNKTIAVTNAVGIAWQYFQNAAQEVPQDIATASANSGTTYSQVCAVSENDSMVTWFVESNAGTATAGTGLTRDGFDQSTSGWQFFHSTSAQASGNFTAQTAGSDGPDWCSIIAAIQTSSATTTNLNLSENLTASIIEHLSRLWTAPRSPSEAVLLQSESTSRAWTAPRNLNNETITITETISSLKGRILEILETMGITESLSRTVSWTRSLTETVTIREILNRVIDVVISNAVTIGDSLTRSWSLLRSLADSVSITDVARFPLNWLKRTRPTTTWTPRTKP